MSGGSYGYVSNRFRETASELLAHRPRDPAYRALAEHLLRLADCMHDVEWSDSSDTAYADGPAAIRKFFADDPRPILASMEARMRETIEEATKLMGELKKERGGKRK